MQNITITKKSKIGLDIGTHSIKVVELREQHGMYTLRNLGIKEIPIAYREEDKRDVTLIARLIKELFAETGIKNKGVVLAIPGSKVSIKVIKMPQIPKSELSEAIKWEMRRHVPFPIEDAVLDYSILDTVIEEGIAKFKLFVAAVPKSVVNDQLAIITEAGLYPEGINVVPFALWKAFEGRGVTQRASTEGETIVLVDIGYERTSISLISDNALQFTRYATIGSNSLTEALLAPITIGDTRITLEYDEAESIKRRHGISSRDSHEMAEGSIPLSRIHVIMRPVLEKLLVEMGRSFDFFVSQLRVPGVDKIILSGGGAMVKGLPEFLSEVLKIDVEVTNPFHDMPSAHGKQIVVMDVDGARPREIFPDFAVATGLALTVPEHIDLIPEEIKIKKQRVVQGIVIAASSFAILLVFATLYWNACKQLSALQMELSVKRSQLFAMATPATKLPQLMELREKVRLEKTYLPEEPFERYQWTEIMKEMSNALPPKAMLTSFSVDAEAPEVPSFEGRIEGSVKRSRKLMRLKGIIFGEEPDDRICLNKFIRFMEASPLFANVRLVSTQDSTEYEQVGKYFEFVCVPFSERKETGFRQ
jgi:type IV pilus assembly protein PilM